MTKDGNEETRQKHECISWILDLPAVKASDKPHVNAASIPGPHDTRWTSIAPIYTCLGG
jgi:hypothetical protein